MPCRAVRIDQCGIDACADLLSLTGCALGNADGWALYGFVHAEVFVRTSGILIGTLKGSICVVPLEGCQDPASCPGKYRLKIPRIMADRTCVDTVASIIARCSMSVTRL